MGRVSRTRVLLETRVLLGLAALLVSCAASPARSEEPPAYPRTPAPEGARLYFIAPTDGELLSGPVTVRFGLVGMGVAPAGVAAPNTGHHHLLIDTGLPPLGEPVPADDHHRHFGGGQTEVTVELAPGEHTLQLLLGDQNHVPHEPPVVSERITIRVR